MENLYRWDIKLFDFDPKSDLGKDMLAYKKKNGEDFVTLEMRFSQDYPFAPPFVRVVRPRFVFRTGHVTIGGSICMELLTNTGWSSSESFFVYSNNSHSNTHPLANDIESILIQIRCELLSGGARLDVNNTHPYSDAEAWEAFIR